MIPYSDACERNRGPILEVLSSCFADRLQVLEIGSGTGQHAVYFAAHLPHLTWHPTERLGSISTLSARIAAEGGTNVSTPTVLDVRQAVWPIRHVDAVFTANTLHIMSWQEVRELFARTAAVLEPRGKMCVYGPFRYDGRYTSDSNREFDLVLKARDADSGLRDLNDLKTLSSSVGLTLTADHDLPAFNRLLTFVREPA